MSQLLHRVPGRPCKGPRVGRAGALFCVRALIAVRRPAIAAQRSRRGGRPADSRRRRRDRRRVCRSRCASVGAAVRLNAAAVRVRPAGRRATSSPTPAAPCPPIEATPPAAPQQGFRDTMPAAAHTRASGATREPAASSPRFSNPFLQQDPSTRARRLARALVSDLVVYYPEKRQRGPRRREPQGAVRRRDSQELG